MNDLAESIKEFSPADGDWCPLESPLEAAFSDENPTRYYNAIFHLFERFPEDDGAGVFWSAVRGMEAIGDYENSLAQRFPRGPEPHEQDHAQENPEFG